MEEGLEESIADEFAVCNASTTMKLTETNILAKCSPSKEAFESNQNQNSELTCFRADQETTNNTPGMQQTCVLQALRFLKTNDSAGGLKKDPISEGRHVLGS